MALTQCPNCKHTPPNVMAHYKHVVPGTTTIHEWDKAPSEGPTPDSAPYPQPCPTDHTMTNAVSIKCSDCGKVTPQVISPTTESK